MSGVSRVSIPNSVRKTIQNIKEIAGNHSDEEIYSMLKECSMDPNETAQKLLFQDTFHEVRRKRDKKKESNREVADMKWRSGSQGRGPRLSRGNYISRYSSHDAGAGRNVGAVKENGISLDTDKENSSSVALQDMDYKAASAENNPHGSMSRSMANLSNGPSKEVHPLAHLPSLNVITLVEESTSAIKDSGISSTKERVSSSIGEGSSPATAVSVGVYTSASDHILVPSPDGSIPESVGTIKREVGFHPSATQTSADSVTSYDASDSELSLSNEAGAQQKNYPFVSGKVQGNLIEVGGTQVPGTFQSTASTATGSASGNRPSSNYGIRSQYPSGHLKAGPAKEWKPKTANVLPTSHSEVLSTSDGDNNKERAGEAVSSLFHVSNSRASDLSAKTPKIKDLYISDSQHVIIPDHLQVPESEITGLSFGSFGSNFGSVMGSKTEPETIKCPEELPESSGDVEENIDQLPPSTREESPVVQDNNYADDQQADVSDDHSSNVADIPSDISPPADYDKPKPEVSLAAEGPYHSVIHAAPAYSNFGLVPQMLGSPFAPFESPDIQARDTARLPSFVVPQPFDPSTNYYASVFRPSTDGDGRFSPFLAPGPAHKYNGNIAVLPAQTVPSSQEGGNSLVFSSTAPTHLVSQATGVLQTSAASQQPLPIFRHPAGVHIPHYPSNYIPYNQYFSPFYVPPQATMHHFLGNAAVFPQQPPSGPLYPPPAANTGATKYPVSQYKPTSNSAPNGQGTYAISPAGYNSAVSVASSTGNEDLSSSHFKENNVFIAGQQSEGSAIWISPPGRDIPTLQASSFYNVPPHGQPVAFAPAQAVHAAAFAGVYHPTQSIAAGSVHPLLQQSQPMGIAPEVVGPPAGMYQQPQRTSQINWVNNF